MNIKLRLNNYFNIIKKEIFDEKGIFIRLIKKNIKKFNFKKTFLYLFFLAYPLFFIINRSLLRRYKTFYPKKFFAESKVKKNNSIDLIAITHAGRSGSYLISNILDSHSQIISLPPSPCFYYGPVEIIKILERIKFSSLFFLNNFKFYRNWWIEILENFIFEKYSEIYLFGSINKSFKGIVEKKDNLDSESFIEWEIKSFQKNVRDFLSNFQNPPTPKQLIFLIYEAYYTSKGIELDKSKIKYICWQRHYYTEEYDFILLKKYFNNIFLITPVRHPVISLDSLIFANLQSSQKINYKADIDKLIKAINPNYMNYLFKHILIRFEDIHSNTKEVIGYLTKVLNIDIEESLFKTTVAGKVFFFRSKNKLISGFNQNIFKSSINLKSLLREDILNLEKKCSNIMKEFNYSSFFTERSKEIKKQRKKNKIKKYEFKNASRIYILGSKIFP